MVHILWRNRNATTRRYCRCFLVDADGEAAGTVDTAVDAGAAATVVVAVVVVAVVDEVAAAAVVTFSTVLTDKCGHRR